MLGGQAFIQTGILKGLVMFGVSLFTQRMIMLGQMPLSSVFQYRIKSRIDRLIVEKTVLFDYIRVETPMFQTTLEGVRRFANTLPNLLFQMLSIFQAVLSLVLMVIQFEGQTWLILPLVFGQILGLLMSLHITKKQHNLKMQQMDRRRMQDYYFKMSTSSQYVKKMLFRLDRLFSSRWDQQTAQLDEEQVAFLRSRVGLNFWGDIAAVAAFAFATVMLLLAPETGTARFVSLTSALLAIQNAITLLITAMSGLHGQLIDDPPDATL